MILNLKQTDNLYLIIILLTYQLYKILNGILYKNAPFNYFLFNDHIIHNYTILVLVTFNSYLPNIELLRLFKATLKNRNIIYHC